MASECLGLRQSYFGNGKINKNITIYLMFRHQKYISGIFMNSMINLLSISNVL